MNVAALELLVPGTLGLLLCGFGAWRCATTLRLARASREWPTAKGRIVACSTRVVRKSHSNPGVRVDVEYEFEVGGASHRGKRVRFGGTANVPKDEAEALARRHPVGSGVTVHYAPDRPELATLETTTPKHLVVLLFVCGFVAIAIVGGVAAALAG
jgi:hypothetical protein